MIVILRILLYHGSLNWALFSTFYCNIGQAEKCLCEILLVKAKNVLLNIILMKKDLICLILLSTDILKVNANEVFLYQYDMAEKC